ncbi:hypothetical protein CTheo_5815 [Ceratobasidium theobromae]|uniref:DUF6534 domain-containing protein n=1 Tax=Ceratobasidium theobromae TaxID=1582974 RepID=A0A5N5QHI6_9AGAM|nr:hypothetical protein CTheo_5815 [Ceratobasidium theobromae]
MYQGLFNSSYIPSPFEMAYINDPDNLLGPWFFSVALSSLLMGMIITQVYHYIEEQAQDPFLVQTLVYFSFAMCMVQRFGNYFLVGIPSTDQKITTVWGSFMGLLVQAYFIHRGFVLSRNWYFLILASMAALIGLIGSIILCVVVFTMTMRIPALYLQSANMMIIGTVIADAIITGFTCWYLLKQRQQSKFNSTNSLIIRLITISMQSAVPPLICAILNLIFNSHSDATSNAWVLLFNILLPYFYVTSLMFTLNSRSKLRHGGGSQGDKGNVYGLHSIPKVTRVPEAPERGVTQIYITTQTRTDQINVGGMSEEHMSSFLDTKD